MKYLAVNNPLTLKFSIATVGITGTEITTSRVPTLDENVKVDGSPAIHKIKVQFSLSGPNGTALHFFTIEGTSEKSRKWINTVDREPYLLEGDSVTDYNVPFVQGSVTTPGTVTIKVSKAGQSYVKID